MHKAEILYLTWGGMREALDPLWDDPESKVRFLMGRIMHHAFPRISVISGISKTQNDLTSYRNGEKNLYMYMYTYTYIVHVNLFIYKSLESLISSVQFLGCVWLFATSWTAACHASLSITNSWNLLKLMYIESVMPSNHLILCCPLIFLSSILPSIRIFSNESALCIRWPKYWGLIFNIRPSNEYLGLISFRIDWFDFLAV